MEKTSKKTALLQIQMCISIKEDNSWYQVWYRNIKSAHMAKPIKETPILKGKDAARFMEARNRPKNPSFIRSEKERVLANYQLLKRAETERRSKSVRNH